MKKTWAITLAFLIIVVLTSGCADSQHQVKSYVTGYEYGFFSGCWHGSISIFAFIGELFSADISIYAVNNSGRWYDFGYIIGLGGAIKLLSIGLRILLEVLGAMFK